MAAAVSSFPTLFIALPCIIFAAMLIAIYHWFAVNCDFRRSLNADDRPPVAASSIGVDEVVVIDVLAAQAVPSSAETNGKSDSMAAVAPSTASDADGEGEKRTCPICLVELGDGDGIRVLPDCMHGFHVQCIETWLELHSTCPVCRAKIGRDEELPEACP